MQKIYKTVSGDASVWLPKISEDLVRKGAISVYPNLAPGTYIAHVQTKAGISDVKFVVVRNYQLALSYQQLLSIIY